MVICVTKGVKTMSKIYRYIHFRDDGYSKGFASVEAALADARERYSAEEKVYIGEDEEYVPAVWYDRVIKKSAMCGRYCVYRLLRGI